MAHKIATRVKPVLHVEVRLRSASSTSGEDFIRADLVRNEVTAWLLRSFLHLKIDQEVSSYDSLKHARHIEEIKVVDFSGAECETSFHCLQDVHLDVQAYQLYESDSGNQPQRQSTADGDEEDSSALMRVPRLPSESLVGVWDSLIFDDDIPARLLRFLTRMMTLTRNPKLDQTAVNFNRLILFQGPQGTGKTTLCRALAQKLAIRMGNQYTHAKLVDVNAHALLSKWFGESGQLVGKLFDNIHTIADETTTLVCVLIDEVETLTASRERAVNGNEVGDAIRATNQLLTALDRLRHRSNVVVLCTTNLMSALDAAFLDRVDIKQYVGMPCGRAIYEILRSCMNELIRCGILVPDEPAEVQETDASAEGPKRSDGQRGSDWEVIEPSSIPSFAEMNVHYFNLPESSPRKLWAISQRCEGLSGRTLRRLPFLALALHTFTDPCTLVDGLAALSKAVDEEPRDPSDKGFSSGRQI